MFFWHGKVRAKKNDDEKRSKYADGTVNGFIKEFEYKIPF